MRRHVGARAVLATAIALWLATPGVASAAGISLAKYGGMHGHPNVSGGLALYWNPARLAEQTGFFLSVDATGIRRAATFDRASAFEDLRTIFRREDPEVLEAFMNDPQVQADYEAANTGRASTSTVGVLPYLALGYGHAFSEQVQVGLSFGLFPAFGGGGSWDKNYDAPARLAGAVDGPQRWASIASNLMILHYTTGLGVRLPDYGLSFGLSVGYVTAELETTRARNANRSDALYNPRGQLEEGRIYFRGNDTTLAFALGGALDLANIRASAVYRFRHDVRLSGPLYIAFGVSPQQETNAFVDFPFPDIFQTALSAQFGRLRLTGITDYTQWSVIVDNDAKTVTPEGDIERLLIIPRQLQNTLSVRGLAEWRLFPDLEIGVMLGIDPSAVPERTMDPGLSDAFKIQAGLGVRWDVNPHLRLYSSLSHDFFFDVESVENIQEPRMSGTYRDVRTYLNLSMEARF